MAVRLKIIKSNKYKRDFFTFYDVSSLLNNLRFSDLETWLERLMQNKIKIIIIKKIIDDGHFLKCKFWTRHIFYNTMYRGAQWTEDSRKLALSSWIAGCIVI